METAASLMSRALLERVGAPAGSPLPMPRVLAVFAHPDDEVLALGGRMERFRDARFLCVTDGAPRDGIDARAHGFGSLDAYRRARRRELEAALRSVAIASRSCLPVALSGRGSARRIADKDAAFHLASLARTVAFRIASWRPQVIVTHPYEGGHPDHDSCAFAVQAALATMQGEQAPVVVEAPFYHAGSRGMETGSFLPFPRSACTVVHRLSPGEQARKQALLACFRSQRETLKQFSVSEEQYRIAPQYDFTQPPHAGQLLYERWGWPLTGGRFRELAQAALRELRIGAVAA